MDEVIRTFLCYWPATALMAIANLFFVFLAVTAVRRRGSRKLLEAMGGRFEYHSLYGRCMRAVRSSIREYDQRKAVSGFYAKARAKLRKSGYGSEYAPAVYLLLLLVAVPLLFVLALLVNYPDVVKPAAAAAGLVLIVEMVIAAERKRINLKLQKYIYKIYKFLHNQVSSGVRVSDAIRTVYEVIDDRELRSILIRLAARYELTMDMDASLEEFRACFDVHEAETLCVALKQGIETGDNQELLARQEEVMFKKYFNYIQVETDSCKNRCIAAVALFTAVAVIMIAVPMLNDAGDALGRIFVN